MFVSLLPLHAMKTMKSTDWFAFCRDFNIRVTRVWYKTSSVSNLYIKTAQHLSEYGNKLLLQASQVEVNQTTSAITGLPATASAFTALQPPAITLEPSGSSGQQSVPNLQQRIWLGGAKARS